MCKLFCLAWTYLHSHGADGIYGVYVPYARASVKREQGYAKTCVDADDAGTRRALVVLIPGQPPPKSVQFMIDVIDCRF